MEKGDHRRNGGGGCNCVLRDGRVCAAHKKGLPEVLTPESERLSVGRASWSVFGVSLSRSLRVVSSVYDIAFFFFFFFTRSAWRENERVLFFVNIFFLLLVAQKHKLPKSKIVSNTNNHICSIQCSLEYYSLRWRVSYLDKNKRCGVLRLQFTNLYIFKY